MRVPKIYLETKDMTQEQRMERTRRSVEEFEAKHGKLRRPETAHVCKVM
jgi:hypothetical protein